MSKPKERTIQLKALEYLKAYYSDKFSIALTRIDSTDERWTKKERGGKRADGLICFEKEGKPYTISLEAKSHKTLGALISYSNDKKFGLHCLIVSCIMTSITILALISFTSLRWYFITPITLAAFVVLLILAAAIFEVLDLDRHKVTNVINQLKQYPANEQWIAYSKHTDNLLLKSPFLKRRNNLDTLEKLCRANNFGLLLVTNKTCLVRINPVPKKGEFLHYYCKEQEILKAISVQTILQE
ncbi:hypothetical protein [Rufibacter aurantiacus]|uniref:hypothetical protein n=1 Tax=Rufibacter aurantiacus TaxID=2817374 RepID=UPI001B31626E|nr:hypothetical protein [Rufibacter aurantiacus]